MRFSHYGTAEGQTAMKRLRLIVYVMALCWQWTSLVVHAEEASPPITLWPLIYHRAEKDQAETDILWPFFRYEREKGLSRYALRPLLFSTEGDPKRDYRNTSLLWPLSIYERKGQELSFHLFPVYWHGRSPTWRYHTIFPVYWDGEGKDYSFLHLWPLFGVDHRQNFTEYSTLYPLFRYGSDPGAGAVDLHAPWPIFHIHSKGDYLSHQFLPLYWYERGPDRSGGLVFPYYWRTAPGYTSQGIFPLWYSSHGPELETDLVFPAYFNRETAKEGLRFITPFYLSRRTEESRLSTLIPVYLNYERGDTGLSIGLPVYFRYRRGAFYFSSLFPFYYRSEDAELRSAFTYYFPLYGTYERGDTFLRRFFLFPLYTHLVDKELRLEAWDLLWPLFYYETSPKTLSVRVLPLYLHTRTPDHGLTIGFPFYWSITSGENSYWHLIPFYGVHTRGDGYTWRTVLGGVFTDTRDARAGLSRQDVLYPIFSRMREGEKGHTWLMPFFYHEEDSRSRQTLGSMALLPPYYIHLDEPGRESFHLWPFYGQEERGSYREYSTIWPLFRSGSDPQNDVSLTHLLLFYRKKEKESTFTTLFPFWRRTETPRTTLTSSLLLHWSRADGGAEVTKRSFLCLASCYLTPEISLVRYQREPHLMRHAIFPIYNYERNDRADALEWSALWPLFSYSSQGELVRQTGFLWQVVSYERQDAEARDFRVLWRFIRSSQAKGSSVFELNPFYYYESKGRSSYWAILGGLIGMTTTEDQRQRLQLLWVF